MPFLGSLGPSPGSQADAELVGESWAAWGRQRRDARHWASPGEGGFSSASSLKTAVERDGFGVRYPLSDPVPLIFGAEGGGVEGGLNPAGVSVSAAEVTPFPGSLRGCPLLSV